jgi:SAM-dependent methyltransferase
LTRVPATLSIDYLGHWRALVEARADQGRRLDLESGRGDEWEGVRARRFRQLVDRTRGTDALLDHLERVVRPSDVVLDVGAGTGRHAIPIASRVRRVVAVEPSAGMRAQLDDALREESAPNVEVVAAGWPAADVDPADVVICSHVVYGVAKIGTFVQRLNEVTRRHCAIVLRHGQREAPILDLFERVWGEKRGLAPTYVDLFGALDQVGIRANVSVVPFAVSRCFARLDDAFAQVRADLLNPSSPEAERLIREFLEMRLIATDGQLGFSEPPAYAAILWWEH